MRRCAVVAICAVLACLAGCVSAPRLPHRAAPSAAGAGPASWSPVEREVLALVNRQRMLHHLSPLRPDARLHRAAVLHCREMAARSYLGHNSPDGRDFAQRAEVQGYRWQRIGENVALLVLKAKPGNLARRVLFGSDHLDRLRSFAGRQGLPLPRTWPDVGQGWDDSDWNQWQRLAGGRGGWMGSAGHRKNILLPGITDIGVGYCAVRERGGRTRHYFAAEFAAPASGASR